MFRVLRSKIDGLDDARLDQHGDEQVQDVEGNQETAVVLGEVELETERHDEQTEQQRQQQEEESHAGLLVGWQIHGLGVLLCVRVLCVCVYVCMCVCVYVCMC